MIKYIQGDLLKSDCDIICHQVNLQGCFGGGLAYQIKQKYPQCERVYKDYLRQNENPLGKVCFWQGEIIIANCFSQLSNFVTDCKSVEKCFDSVRCKALMLGLKSVGIPFCYGCGIAIGNWEETTKIINKVFANSKIECKIYKLKEQL